MRLSPQQLCLGDVGRRKWFVAIQEIHAISSSGVDIHSVFFQNGGAGFDSPARVVASSLEVTDIYIRHYQNILLHGCRLAVSPSVLTLATAQSAAATAPSRAPLRIYVAFAACGRFKVYLNGQLLLQPDARYEVWRLYSAYAHVSVGDVFSFTMERCGEFKGFIGCFGSSVCTGLNHGSGWFCTHEQPRDGWMQPNFSFGPSLEAARPACSIRNDTDIWSVYSRDNTDRQCVGLDAFPSAADAASCAAACCANPACSRFQWCGGGDCTTSLSSASKCWIGVSSNCEKQETGWTSGLRPSLQTPWVHADSLGIIRDMKTILEPGLDNRARWLFPANGDSGQQTHCRWELQPALA